MSITMLSDDRRSFLREVGRGTRKVGTDEIALPLGTPVLGVGIAH